MEVLVKQVRSSTFQNKSPGCLNLIVFCQGCSAKKRGVGTPFPHPSTPLI